MDGGVAADLLDGVGAVVAVHQAARRVSGQEVIALLLEATLLLLEGLDLGK